MNLRPAIPEDRSICEVINEHCLRYSMDLDPHTAAAVGTFYQKHDWFRQVTEEGELYLLQDSIWIVGFGGLQFAEDLLKGDHKKYDGIFIDKMRIKQEHQNQGLGSQLLEFLEDRARQHDYEEIFSEAFPNAVGFYEKNGYATIGKPYSYNLDGIKVEQVMMKKKL